MFRRRRSQSNTNRIPSQCTCEVTRKEGHTVLIIWKGRPSANDDLFRLESAHKPGEEVRNDEIVAHSIDDFTVLVYTSSDGGNDGGGVASGRGLSGRWFVACGGVVVVGANGSHGTVCGGIGGNCA